MQNRVIVSDRIAGAFAGRRHLERPSFARLFFRTELVAKEAPDEGARALRRVQVEDALVVVCRCRCERADRGADCGALPRSRPPREAASRRLLRGDGGGTAQPEAHGCQSACYRLAMRAATKCRLPSRLPGDAVEAVAPFSSRFRMRSAARCPAHFFVVADTGAASRTRTAARFLDWIQNAHERRLPRRPLENPLALHSRRWGKTGRQRSHARRAHEAAHRVDQERPDPPLVQRGQPYTFTLST
jgi:hypothetical protein